jgi:transcriptional regulator with XRE-family HTH domain
MKEALDFKGMLVKELADKTKISRRTLGNYLRSDASIPPADNAVCIAGALGVSVEYLVTGDERRNHPPPISCARSPSPGPGQRCSHL